jgi:phosphatidylcholine synthase
MNRIVAAWSVHLYTGLGAAIGLFALEAIAKANYRLAFVWMALATFIDCTDGALARRARVREVLPHFDGSKLDDIVDYLNYVVVPMALAYHAALLPGGAGGLALASVPLLASGYGFCQEEAKTTDHFFTGFPSYWNIVVFYFYVLATAVWFNTVLLLAFSILVFVPIRYLYPSRSAVARRATHVLVALWGVCVVILLAQLPRPSPALAWVSLLFPAYYFAVSLHAHFRPSRS